MQQGQALAAVQAEQKEAGGRLQQLEEKVQHLQLRGGSSTADTDGGAPNKALILEGCDNEGPAAETLQKINDMEQAFCLGARRDDVIIPFKARMTESVEQLRERLQHALGRIRTANIAIESKVDGRI